MISAVIEVLDQIRPSEPHEHVIVPPQSRHS